MLMMRIKPALLFLYREMTTYLYVTENQPFWTFEAACNYALKDGRWPTDIYKYNAKTLDLLKILHPIHINDGSCCGKDEFEEDEE